MPNTPMMYGQDKRSRAAAKKDLADANKGKLYRRDKLTIRFTRRSIEFERTREADND